VPGSINEDNKVDLGTTSKDTESAQAFKFNVINANSVSFDSDNIPKPVTGISDDIKEWLARPLKVVDGSWSTAQVLGTNLFSYPLHSLFGSSLLIQNKVAGYRWIRCKFKFRVQLNATPFHAGCFMLQWYPMSAGESAVTPHRTPISSSQLPGVFVTTADDSVEMCVPWVNPTFGYDLASSATSFDWGNIVAKVFSPLATGTGAASVTYAVFMWLEDVELFGLRPQSGSKVKTQKKPKRLIPSDSEKNNGEGPITRAFGVGEEVASSLSAIPLFAPVAKPASWVFNTLGQVSSIFGWSKPSLGEGGKMISVHQSSDFYNHNCMGTDNSAVMTPFPDQGITPTTSLTIRSEDEMSVRFVARQWSYLTKFSFSTSNIANDSLYTQTLNLSYFSNFQSVDNGSGSFYHVHSMTPLAYLARVFSQWRGPLEFKFIFVKTGYHAGQLQFAFNNSTLNPNISEQMYCHRDVVDIQMGEEYTVIVPWIQTMPYLGTGNTMGFLSINAVTSLVCPNTVASSIEVLVFVRGGDGIDFQKPTNSVPIPCFAPQGFSVDETGVIASEPIGSAPPSLPNNVMSQWTVGENIESILSLVKRFTPIWSELVSSTPIVMAAGSYVSFNPHFIFPVSANGVSPLSLDHFSVDILARFSWLYLFRRGGVKIRAKSFPNNGGPCTTFSYNPIYEGFQTYHYVDTPANPFGLYDAGVDFSGDIHQGSTSVVFPQYSKILGYYTTGNTLFQSAYVNENSLRIGSSNSTDFGGPQIGNNIVPYRCAADDFHYSFFLGIPTCLLDFNTYVS
jgi:hypothetical protein